MSQQLGLALGMSQKSSKNTTYQLVTKQNTLLMMIPVRDHFLLHLIKKINTQDYNRHLLWLDLPDDSEDDDGWYLSFNGEATAMICQDSPRQGFWLGPQREKF
jgi:hypothetical protein